jgi:hypothetical protein
LHRRNHTDCRLRVYGDQRDTVEVDLLAQIVIMLGRQLAAENESEETETDVDDESGKTR